MFQKIILHFILILTVLVSIIVLFFMYKIKSIDSKFQIETVKVLSAYYTNDFYLFGGLENQSKFIGKKSKRDQDEFYYSIIILGSKYLENNGGGVLVLYTLLDSRDNQYILEKIKALKLSEDYKNLNVNDQSFIDYWERILMKMNKKK